MLISNTALGIDLSSDRINLALLQKTKSGVKLIRTASGAVPAGAIKDGNIEDPAILAKAIRELKTKNKMRADRTAISLVASPVLLQILDLPEPFPSNIGQFVRDEVKNYAILPRENVVLDFCGMKSSFKSKARRVLVAAAENQKITEAAKTINSEGLGLEAIEPAALAYIRACYETKIAKKIGKNLIFAIVHNNTFTLCLFRNQSLDFLRTKKIETEVIESERYSEWLAEEIYTILQFYELEVLEKNDQWQITLITPDAACSPEDLKKLLANNVEGVDLEVRRLEDAYLDTTIGNLELSVKPSAVAIGLAMKLLDTPCGGLNINLVPAVVDEIKVIRKQRFAIVKVAAVIFAIIFVYVGFISSKGQRTNRQIEEKKQTKQTQNMQSLVTKQIQLGEQISKISKDIRNINSVLKTVSPLNWGQILGDISHKIPKKVQIASLTSGGGSKMSLDGYALSYEAVNDFIDLLNKSKFIESASLAGTEQTYRSNGSLEYFINCTLAQ